MKAEDIRAAVCRWISSMGIRAVQSPSNAPAPAGTHIAVSVLGVTQHGSEMHPAPGEGRRFVYQHVATVQLYEVEGEGDDLRRVKDSLQNDRFDAFVKETFRDGTGLDYGFSVWEIGEIQDVTSQDGPFFVRQNTFTFEVQFNDHSEKADVPAIESAEGTVGDEKFNTDDVKRINESFVSASTMFRGDSRVLRRFRR